MGLLFGGSRRRVARNGGLIGSLFGYNRYYQPRQRGFFGGNPYYRSRQQRGVLRNNSLLGMAAIGALAYAARRFMGGQGSPPVMGGGDNISAGGGGSDWGSGSNFDQGNSGQSW